MKILKPVNQLFKKITGNWHFRSVNWLLGYFHSSMESSGIPFVIWIFMGERYMQ